MSRSKSVPSSEGQIGTLYVHRFRRRQLCFTLFNHSGKRICGGMGTVQQLPPRIVAAAWANSGSVDKCFLAEGPPPPAQGQTTYGSSLSSDELEEIQTGVEQLVSLIEGAGAAGEILLDLLVLDSDRGGEVIEALRRLTATITR